MTELQYLAQSMDRMNTIGRSAARKRKVETLCPDPIPMSDEGLPAVHLMASRPDDCFTCCRTRENSR